MRPATRWPSNVHQGSILIYESVTDVWRFVWRSSGAHPEPCSLQTSLRKTLRPATSEVTILHGGVNRTSLVNFYVLSGSSRDTKMTSENGSHTHQCLTFTQMSACSATGVLACWYSTTSKHYKVLTITGEVPKEASVDMIKLLKLAVAHEQQSHTRSFQRRFNPFLNTLKLRSSPKVKATCPESGSAQVDLNSKPRDLLSMTVCFGTASNELRSELNRFHFIRTSSLPACFPNPSLKSPLHCPT